MINNSRGKLTNLRFADDIIIFAQSYTDLEQIMTELQKEASKIGLKINQKKKMHDERTTKPRCN